jgi:dsRNA-specific ribonuclease
MGKIEFRTIEIEEKIRMLADFSLKISNSPGFKKKEREKFCRWNCELKRILEQISLFEKDVLPLIEKDLGYPFSDRNLVLTAMMQPSVKNTFSDIKTDFENDTQLPISLLELNLLIAAPDTAESMAWVGDFAIRYAVSLYIWETGLTPEQLHDRREVLVTDKNLSKLCDQWMLYDYRFYQDSAGPHEKTREKIQGTLTEAIFGVIFVERKIEGVQKAIHLIDPNLNPDK